MWRCEASVFVEGLAYGCGQPAAAVDAARGCAVCAEHQRGPTQQMTCCRCGQRIELGQRWEYWNAMKRKQDGSDPVICGACVTASIRETLTAMRRVPPEAWGAVAEGGEP